MELFYAARLTAVFFSIVCFSFSNTVAQPSGVVSTLAGSGTFGYTDGTGTSAKFDYPPGVAVDGAGNVYVADQGNNRIRKITASGVVSTLAGSGTPGNADGTGTSAQFSYPYGVAVDGAGNVYVADQGNNRIRKITASGVVSTLAGSTSGYTDGTGTSAQFNNPYGVAVDGAGNVYVADRYNDRIRKITTSGVVSTLAGSTNGYTDGTGTSAQFYNPFGVAVDGAGNVYVADLYNHRIRKITASGVVSTLAGNGTYGYTDGTGTSAKFNRPTGIAVDGAGNVYVADLSNHRIRKITTSGVVSTLAGSTYGYTDGTGTSAKFYYPSGVAVDGAGNVYVADYHNHRIRKITFCSETTETITANVCDSYTSPSGKTWTTSNTYMDTIANDAGCDSVITVNLTVRDKTTETITANVCDSYTSPSGKTWFKTGTYKDTIANDAGCDSIITFNVFIGDTTLPTVITQNITLYLDTSGNTSTTASAINNGSSDNCSIKSMTLSQSSFDCSDFGTNTIYLIVTDVNGNVDSASAVVTVHDVIKPTIVTQNLTVSLDASGNGSITAARVDNGSTDNCSIATRTLSQSSFDCSEVGANTVT